MLVQQIIIHYNEVILSRIIHYFLGVLGALYISARIMSHYIISQICVTTRCSHIIHHFVPHIFYIANNSSVHLSRIFFDGNR